MFPWAPRHLPRGHKYQPAGTQHLPIALQHLPGAKRLTKEHKHLPGSSKILIVDQRINQDQTSSVRTQETLHVCPRRCLIYLLVMLECIRTCLGSLWRCWFLQSNTGVRWGKCGYSIEVLGCSREVICAKGRCLGDLGRTLGLTRAESWVLQRGVDVPRHMLMCPEEIPIALGNAFFSWEMLEALK